ncbi:MAG: adenylate/guanylate cyclase domain-containing protein [Elusimicrobiota bacterium]
MPAELLIALTGRPESKVALRGAFTLGRGKDNDVVLADIRVSRSHALLRPFARGKYFLLDMGSANGTFLNGRLVTNPVELKDGDAITIADCELKYIDLSRRTGSGGASVEIDTASMDTAIDVSKEAISILVVDIRNFTGLTEAIPAKELPGFVGSWFRDGSATIESHGGVIDKYIGDAIMAYWLKGPKGADSDLARGPLDSALELVEMARLYHGQLSARHPELSFAVGCGIHMGEAMFGSMGGSSRRDFTAIGDCVNGAFRIESLCKELKRPIMVSEEIKAAAGAAYEYEDMGLQKLKGKANDVRVYSVRPAAAV